MERLNNGLKQTESPTNKNKKKVNCIWTQVFPHIVSLREKKIEKIDLTVYIYHIQLKHPGQYHNIGINMGTVVTSYTHFATIWSPI